MKLQYLHFSSWRGTVPRKFTVPYYQHKQDIFGWICINSYPNVFPRRWGGSLAIPQRRWGPLGPHNTTGASWQISEPSSPENGMGSLRRAVGVVKLLTSCVQGQPVCHYTWWAHTVLLKTPQDWLLKAFPTRKFWNLSRPCKYHTYSTWLRRNYKHSIVKRWNYHKSSFPNQGFKNFFAIMRAMTLGWMCISDNGLWLFYYCTSTLVCYLSSHHFWISMHMLTIIWVGCNPAMSIPL